MKCACCILYLQLFFLWTQSAGKRVCKRLSSEHRCLHCTMAAYYNIFVGVRVHTCQLLSNFQQRLDRTAFALAGLMLRVATTICTMYVPQVYVFLYVCNSEALFFLTISAFLVFIKANQFNHFRSIRWTECHPFWFFLVLLVSNVEGGGRRGGGREGGCRVG